MVLILKNLKNLKLANQILQISNSFLNVKVEPPAASKDKFIDFFKTLMELGTNFITVDIIKDLNT
jgi:hypothetical protein